MVYVGNPGIGMHIGCSICLKDFHIVFIIIGKMYVKWIKYKMSPFLLFYDYCLKGSIYLLSLNVKCNTGSCSVKG